MDEAVATYILYRYIPNKTSTPENYNICTYQSAQRKCLFIAKIWIKGYAIDTIHKKIIIVDTFTYKFPLL